MYYIYILSNEYLPGKPQIRDWRRDGGAIRDPLKPLSVIVWCDSPRGFRGGGPQYKAPMMSRDGRSFFFQSLSIDNVLSMAV